MNYLTDYYKNLCEHLQQRIAYLNRLLHEGHHGSDNEEDPKAGMPQRSMADMELETAAMNPSGNFKPQGTADIRSERFKLKKATERQEEDHPLHGPVAAGAGVGLLGSIPAMAGAAAGGPVPLALLTTGAVAGSAGGAISRSTGLDELIARKALDKQDYTKSLPPATSAEIQKASDERHQRELERYGRRI